MSKNCAKSFQQKPILTDLNFHLEAGDRLALLGPNGSGKTLLIKIIATLIKPTSGSIEIAGYDATKDFRAVRPLIGYIPQTFEGYPTLSVQGYLEFFAAAYKLDKRQRATGIQDVLDLMDLATLARRKDRTPITRSETTSMFSQDLSARSVGVVDRRTRRALRSTGPS